MAARFCDSFDAYATADLLLRWTSQSGATISAANGRNGTASLRFTTYAQSATLTLDAQSTWVVGRSLKVAAIPSGNQPILFILDANTEQCSLWLMNDGTFAVYRGGTTKLGQSSAKLTAGAATYIEFKLTINGSTGIASVNLNGASILNLTGQNTQATGNATANQIRLGGSPSAEAATIDSDDLYILDGTGAANNTFLGDTRVQALHSTGAGHKTQFSLGAGTSNWQAVSETAEDGDTTYVDSATAGQIDTYTFGSLTPVSGTIPFIQTMLVARKDDAGTRTVADVISDGTTDHVGTSNNVGTSYQQFLTIHETDPVTSAAFTLANVNARQYGVEEVA